VEELEQAAESRDLVLAVGPELARVESEVWVLAQVEPEVLVLALAGVRELTGGSFEAPEPELTRRGDPP
jgi:hypothetical protein